jgi:transposase
LAQLLRADLLPEAWIAPPAVRQLRALLRHRVQLVRLRTLLRNRIHAVLADHGYGRPAGCWSGPGRDWLASLPLPAASREVVEDGLALIDATEARIDRLDGEIRQRARSDPRVKVLTQLPGVGPFTALVILAEIGDITRFPTATKLVGYTGLCPRVKQSGDSDLRGPLSKHGPRYLRWALMEAAQHAARHPQYRERYQATKRRLGKQRGAKVAQVELARQLAEAIWHILTRQQPFAPAGAKERLAA